MTSSRVIRGMRAKIFLCVCGILAVAGLLICYDNILSELAEVKNANEMCHQQQENLSTQLQVISEYKQKLEKSLKSVKAEHQQNKEDMQLKINEEKNKNEKQSNDALLKYNSLQQHYNLLQTENEDFKEECSNTQKKQQESINSLQAQLKELKEELKKVEASKEQLKTRFIEIKLENTKLKLMTKKTIDNQSQNLVNYYADKYHEIYDKYDYLKEKCHEETPRENPLEIRASSGKSNIKLPAFNGAEQPSSSTKSVSKPASSASPPQGSLNGVKPLIVPSITPDTSKRDVFLKPPQAAADVKENQNGQPEVQQVNAADKIDKDWIMEKDNGAHEVFDAPANNIPFEGLGLAGDVLSQQDQKDDEIVGKEKKKKQRSGDYKDLAHEEDIDDDDPYVDNAPRQADIAIRN